MLPIADIAPPEIVTLTVNRPEPEAFVPVVPCTTQVPFVPPEPLAFWTAATTFVAVTLQTAAVPVPPASVTVFPGA